MRLFVLTLSLFPVSHKQNVKTVDHRMTRPAGLDYIKRKNVPSNFR